MFYLANTNDSVSGVVSNTLEYIKCHWLHWDFMDQLRLMEADNKKNKKKKKRKLMKISIRDGCQVLCKDKNPKKVVQSPLVWHETDE